MSRRLRFDNTVWVDLDFDKWDPQPQIIDFARALDIGSMIFYTTNKEQ